MVALTLYNLYDLTMLAILVAIAGLVTIGPSLAIVLVWRRLARIGRSTAGDPVCSDCGYTLVGLGDAPCPECGSAKRSPASGYAPRVLASRRGVIALTIAALPAALAIAVLVDPDLAHQWRRFGVHVAPLSACVHVLFVGVVRPRRVRGVDPFWVAIVAQAIALVAVVYAEADLYGLNP